MDLERTEPIDLTGASVSFEEARQDAGVGGGFLVKPDNLREAITTLPIDEVAKGRLVGKGRSRDVYHLLRLLSEGRATAEKEFGLAYLQFSGEVFDELEAQDRERSNRVVATINHEGPNTVMWWTFAPYLYTNLLQRGVQDRESIRRIMGWGESHLEGGNYNPTLRGLEMFNGKDRDDSYFLSSNPQGPSHVFTNYVARQIVDNYLMSPKS